MKRFTGIARCVDYESVRKSMQHETTAEVYSAAERILRDVLPGTHPLEKAEEDQPPVMMALKSSIVGLDPTSKTSTKVTLPEDSLFTLAYPRF